MSRDAGCQGQRGKDGECLHCSKDIAFFTLLSCELAEHGAGEGRFLAPFMLDWQSDRHWYLNHVVS
jgi:hypothetical protein